MKLFVLTLVLVTISLPQVKAGISLHNLKHKGVKQPKEIKERVLADSQAMLDAQDSQRIDTALSHIMSLRNKLDRLKSKLSTELETSILFLKKHFSKRNYFDRYDGNI